MRTTFLNVPDMKINLLSCGAQRPDKRAISQAIAEFAINTEESLALELTDMLLEGDIIDLEVDDSNSGSLLRALRKHSVEYEIEE